MTRNASETLAEALIERVRIRFAPRSLVILRALSFGTERSDQ
jgi:hypothetical protein